MKFATVTEWEQAAQRCERAGDPTTARRIRSGRVHVILVDGVRLIHPSLVVYPSRTAWVTVPDAIGAEDRRDYVEMGRSIGNIRAVEGGSA